MDRDAPTVLAPLPRKAPDTPSQQEKFLSCSADIAVFGGAAGGGKGQPLGGLVWTPWGRKQMGDLSVGDKVIGSDGRPTSIVRVHELGERELLRVSFRDGASLVTTTDHLWLTWKGHHRTPAEAKLRQSADLEPGYRIPLANAISSNKPRPWSERRIAPYDFGVLLGDGCFRGDMVTVSVHDGEIKGRLRLPLSGEGPDYRVLGAMEESRRLGLEGCYSHEKFVPSYYDQLPVDERWAFLRGYMDADGTVRKDGKVTATTTSPQLRDGIIRVVESLGGVADYTSRTTKYMYDGERREGRQSYRVRVKVPRPERLFSVRRKRSRCRPFQSLSREVESVDPAGSSVSRCISVANPDGLYVAGERPVLTHNTVGLLLEPLRHKDVKTFRAVFFRRTYPRIVKAGGMWDESEELYSGIAEPVKGDLLWRFPSGARFEFSHMQHEKDRLDFKGAQIPYIGWDQLEEFTEKQFWYLVSRNRSTCGVRPYIRATCNPVPPDDETGGWLHDLLSWWIDSESGLPIRERSGQLRWFIRDGDELVWADSPEDLEEYERPPQSLTFIPATLEDNPLLEDSDPGYRGRLMSLPRVERKRLLEGNWMVRPTAGMIFNRGWFPIVDASPSHGEVVRYWDKAGTEGGGARSAGVRIRECEGAWYIEDVTQGRWSAKEREEVILQTAESDGYGVQVYVEQEPGSSGKESAQLTIQNLKGFSVHADRVTGSKVERARGLSAQAEAGNVKLVRGDWNESFLRQAQRFEAGATQIDAVDAACGAFNKLVVEEEEEGYALRWR